VGEPAAIENAAPNPALFRLGVNPLLRQLFRTPLKHALGRQLMMLRFTGRKSGRLYNFPVGRMTIDSRLAATSRRPWVVNFRGGARCELILDGQRTAAVGTLLEDEAETARIFGSLIEGFGRENAVRRLGLRVTVDRAPTQEELLDAVRRIRLALVFFDVT
jgi:hypothetical protein